MVSDDKPLILGLGIAFPVIAVISVVLRFEARRINRLKLGADDWTILAALVLSIGTSVIIVLDSQLGNLGGHTKFDSHGLPVLDQTYRYFGQNIYALELIVWPAVGVTKISVLLLYKRIFVSKNFQRTVWIFVGVMVAWILAFTVGFIFNCWPIESHWDPTIPATCVDSISFFTTALATDVITDGLILLLPIWNVWQLQMPVHQKLAVIGIFLLGGLVTVTGIIRIHYLTKTYASLAESKYYNDVNYSYGPPFYWSIIETCVGVLSACLPTFRPLWKGYKLDSMTSKLRTSFGSLSLARLTSYRPSSKDSLPLSEDTKVATHNHRDPMTNKPFLIHTTNGYTVESVRTFA